MANKKSYRTVIANKVKQYRDRFVIHPCDDEQQKSWLQFAKF